MKYYLIGFLFVVLTLALLVPVYIMQWNTLYLERMWERSGDDSYHCMLDATNLETKLKVDFNSSKRRYERMSKQLNYSSVPLARFVPHDCEPLETVAIIVPIRDREEHLRILLGHLHPILQKQLLRYQIYTITQASNTTFNKGILMNRGFQFVLEEGRKAGHPYDCFIFHDVDMLPESELNLYRCGKTNTAVRHMGHSINKYNYASLCCGITVGGILAFTGAQYQKVNGYSNKYWGWGGEDDDMLGRIRAERLSVERNFGQFSRYTMIPHDKDHLNPVNNVRHALLKGARNRYHDDGLSSVKAAILAVEYFALYVNVVVDVGEPPSS